MRKGLGVALAAVLLSSGSISLGDVGQPGATSALREIVATGVGATDEDAKKNAFQNAVEQAVGVYVDASTLVKNEKLIEERILTYSNAYIKHFQVLTTSRAGGNVKVKIKADVQCDRLVEKLQAMSVTVRKPIDGSSLAAEVETKTKRDADAWALILEASKGFPVSCLKAVAGKVETQRDGLGGDVKLTVPVTISVDPAKYKQFDAAFRRILEQTAKKSRIYSFEPLNLAKFHEPGVLQGYALQDGVPLYVLRGIEKVQQGAGGRKRSGHERTPGSEATFGVMLCNKAESRLRRISWTMYELDETLRPAFEGSWASRVQIAVRLLDADGKLVAERTRSGFFPPTGQPVLHREIEPGSLIGVGESAEKRGNVSVNVNLVIPQILEPDAFQGTEQKAWDRRPLRVLPVAPYFYYSFWWNGAGAFSPEVRFVMPFDLGTDELKRMSTVECSLSLGEGKTTIFGEKKP